MCSFAETTHTPQGDGNGYRCYAWKRRRETTHTPQGDGNYQQELDKYTQKKQPTPRKGTETFHPFVFVLLD